MEIVADVKPRRNDKDFVAVVQAIKNLTLRLLKDMDGMQEFFLNVQNFPDPIGLVNMICTQSPFPTDQKMALLLEDNVKEREPKELLAQLTRQEQMPLVAEEIQSSARQSFDQQQRHAFLQQQMEAIRQELYGDKR